MNDIDDEVREMLRQKAQDVPPNREVPRSLVRRSRRRIALNAVAVSATVVVLAVGAFAGVRALSGPSTSELLGRGPSSPSGPTPSAPVTCTTGDLRAVATMQGAAGSREGTITLTNLSNTTCTLEGTPTITLLDQDLAPITSGVRFMPSPAGWQVDRLLKPAGWPVVTLAPFDSASVRLRWGNWCPQGRAAPLWRIDLPGGGVDVNGMEQAGPPPCNGPGLPSTVEVGPFEPAPGS